VIGTLLIINITAVIGGIFIGWWLRGRLAERMSIQPDPEVNPGSAERGSG
jgi:hypothetical protein